MLLLRIPLSLALLVVAAVSAAGYTAASAQFGPPATLVGSLSDAAGTFQEGVDVEALIGNTVCGRAKTFYAGEGSSRVTMYAVDVFSREQTSGCGTDGAEIKIKVGNKTANESARWRAGLTLLDLTFGAATPVPIPTSTPTPPRTNTPAPSAATPTPGGAATTTTGTPPAQATSVDGGTTTPTATPTLGGALSSRTPVTGAGSDSGGDDGGFPVWGIAALVLGGLGLIGGGAGVMIARSRAAGREAEAFVDGPPA